MLLTEPAKTKGTTMADKPLGWETDADATDVASRAKPRNLGADIIREKLASEELDNGYLGDAVRAMLDASEKAPEILEFPFAWMVGYFGYGSLLFERQDEQ